MNYKKMIGVSSSFLFLILIALKFQNCGASVDGENSLVSSDSEQVIVDDLNKEKVAFAETLIVVRDDADETLFHGNCQRKADGLVLVSKLLDSETREEIASTSTECLRGGFSIKVPKILDLSCTKDYVLAVESINGDQAALSVRRKCAPITKVFLEEEKTE